MASPTDQEVRNWFASNPGATDAQIVATMQQYGVTPAQVARATNTNLGEVNRRFEAVPAPAAQVRPSSQAPDIPVSNVQQIPGTNQYISRSTGLIYNADQIEQKEIGIGEGVSVATFTKPGAVAANEPTTAGFGTGSFDFESGAFNRQGSLYEDVWKELAKANGIEPTVTVETGAGGEDSQPVMYTNPEFINYVNQKKAEGLDVSVEKAPGYKYKFDVAVTQNGQPVNEPKRVQYGQGFASSISDLAKDLAPIAIAALSAGFGAPLGASIAPGLSAAGQAALGSGIIAGGVTALGGGDIGDIVKGALLAGGGSYLMNSLGAGAGIGAADAMTGIDMSGNIVNALTGEIVVPSNAVYANTGSAGFSGFENELAGLAQLEAGQAIPGPALPGIEAALAGGSAGVGSYLAAGSAAAAGAAGAAGTGAGAGAGAGAAGAAGAAGGAAAGAGAGLGTAALINAAGQVVGGALQSQAAQEAAGAQEAAAMAGIEELRRQFDISRGILQPFVQAGTTALGGMQPFVQGGQTAYQKQLALSGVLGPEAQQAAITEVEQSPFFQSQIEQGERALLQRASATGGLRGGNLQAGLAQFRPQMLQQAVEQQYGRLGGLSATGLGVLGQQSQLGQASAAGQAAAATNLGQNVAGLMQQQGAAQAGAALASQAPWQALAQIPSTLAGLSLYSGKPISSLFG